MELILFVALALATAVPLMKLLPRYGIHPFWAAVVIIPLGLIVLLWVMAARMDREGRSE